MISSAFKKYAEVTPIAPITATDVIPMITFFLKTLLISGGFNFSHSTSFQHRLDARDLAVIP
jgi:hypothetical protein